MMENMKKNKIIILVVSVLSVMMSGCISENDICAPQPADPGFHWESFHIYPLDDQRWTTTRTNESIAVTNPERKTQIMVTWRGGMATGEKGKPVLKISQDGGKPQETNLKSFYLTTDNVKETCTVRFQGLEGQEGTIKIPL